MTKQLQDVGYLYVKAILQKEGEISLDEIKSMPFFDGDSDYNAVISALKRDYNIRIVSRQISSYPVLEWEEMIELCS
jgi:hypothetical protein